MALRCPRCRTDLAAEPHGGARFDRCARCGGLCVNNAVLRKFVPRERLRDLWRNFDAGRPGDACPSCERPLVSSGVTCAGQTVEIDACRPCQLLWFDAEGLAAFSPARQEPERAKGELSPKAMEALMKAKIEVDQVGGLEKSATAAKVAVAVIRTLLSAMA